MKTNKRWTDEDIETLKNNYYMGAPWLANELERTINAVKFKAYSLGLSVESCHIKYTDEEIKDIKENYNKMSAAALARYIGRSTYAVYNKIHRLKKAGEM